MSEGDVEERGVRLRVTEAFVDDVEKGIVRVDPYDLAKLGVQVGMPVAVVGERRTAAISAAAPQPLLGGRRIQMDGMLRENAGAGVGDVVTVYAVEVLPARTLLLAPLEDGRYGSSEVAAIREGLAGRVVVYGDRVKVTSLARRGHIFRVSGTDPEGVVVACAETDVRLEKADVAVRPTATLAAKYEDIGGLEEELQRVRELVELPLKHPRLFAHLRIEAPRGVLLHGPPGSGKTLIARAIASEVKAHFIHVNGPEIIHKFYGESEAKLREIFEEAQRRAPSIIFLDELDAIAPKRASVSGDVEKRVVAQLLALMDGLVSRGEVVIISATNLPEAIDPALRRPGRLDREIQVNVPSASGRLRILEIHSRGMPLAEDVNLVWLSEITHGFVGADVEALCKEAGMLALRDALKEADYDDSEVVAAHTTIRLEHFTRALRAVEPTATRELSIERPHVRWEDIGGVDSQREAVLSALLLPRRWPQVFAKAQIPPPHGFLLAGPSGTGKTLFARALATEMGLKLITVTPALLFSKWVGESEKALAQVFRKARQASPCVLFFDELDALVPVRTARAELDGGVADRLTSQFFAELDELTAVGQTVLIAATNRPDLVDPAVVRPGRFGFVVTFAPPDTAGREAILSVHLRNLELAGDVDLAGLARDTDGLSGADLANVCHRAVLEEVQRRGAALTDADTDHAVTDNFTLGLDAIRVALGEVRLGRRAWGDVR